MTTFTRKPWDGTQSRWKNPAVWVQDCLIDMSQPGQPKKYEDGKLPYREPDGAVNVNALHAAAAALAGGRGGVMAAPQMKRNAARKLLALYRELKEDAPDSLKRLAM